MGMKIDTDVINCARCGQNHTQVTFSKLGRAMAPPETNAVWSYWAPCPTTGEPIMLSTEAKRRD